MRMSILLAAWCVGFINPVEAQSATPPAQQPGQQVQAPAGKQAKNLSELQIANFWRAKSNLQTAAQAFEDAKKALDASVADIKATCGHDGQFGPDGHPSCGPEVPQAQTPAVKPEVKK